MTDQERQATLLAAYQTALARDPAAPVPAGLDPRVALAARRLAQLPGGPAPDPAFVAALARRLDLPLSSAPRAAVPQMQGLLGRTSSLPAQDAPITPDEARRGPRGPWSRIMAGANAIFGAVALVAILGLALALVLPGMRSGGWGGAEAAPTATTGAARPSSCTGTLAPQKAATPPNSPIPATPTGREAELYIPCTFERDPGLQRAEDAGLVHHLNAAQTVNGSTVTIERVYVDANRIVIAYVIAGPTWATDNFRLLGVMRPTLTDSAGRTYGHASNGQEGYGGMANGRQTFRSILTFDTPTLPPELREETFRLSFGPVAIEDLAAARNGPSPTNTINRDAQGTPVGVRIAPQQRQPVGTIGPWEFAFTLPIVPARVAEVRQTVVAPVTAAYAQGEANSPVPRCNACPDAPPEGVAITVERVVTTPSETRVYLRFQGPALASRQTGWEVRDIGIQDPGSPPTRDTLGQWGTRPLPDGSAVLSFSNPLYDKQGEWTLTIGELWALVPPDQTGDQRGYVRVRLRGEWAYRFTMP